MRIYFVFGVEDSKRHQAVKIVDDQYARVARINGTTGGRLCRRWRVRRARHRVGRRCFRRSRRRLGFGGWRDGIGRWNRSRCGRNCRRCCCRRDNCVCWRHQSCRRWNRRGCGRHGGWCQSRCSGGDRWRRGNWCTTWRTSQEHQQAGDSKNKQRKQTFHTTPPKNLERTTHKTLAIICAMQAGFNRHTR